ncbi:MAG: NAD(P)-dependent oxidoreductase [Burkholderiales bacterium]
MSARILFLDDDPVVQVFRQILIDAENPWIADYFAPEIVDLSNLLAAAKGLRRRDGAVIAAARDGEFEDATAIIFRRGAVTRDLLARHPRLTLIQRLGESTEDIDLAAAAERNIRVSCLPRRTLIYTAEHGILLMLALAKRLFASDRAVREGAGNALRPGSPGSIVYNWAAIHATGLHGKTLGIVGMGQVGFLLAKLAHAFGMSILYTKRRRATPDQEAAVGARMVELGALLSVADFVSLMLPNTPDNARYAGPSFFAAMRRDAVFINMSRGALVDEDALYSALVSSRIAGAALDVHLAEPRPIGDRFAALNNVILTPHLAGGAKSGLLDEFEVIARNCHAAFRGEPVTHEVRVQ